MKITLEITRDNHNTHPTATIEFEDHEDGVAIQISDYDRQVIVDKDEFVRLMRVLEG